MAIDKNDFIIRQYFNKKRNKFINYKLYMFYCDHCGNKRGYILNNPNRKGLCVRCSLLQEKPQSGFRKNTHNNVDYNDRITIKTKTGHKIKYKTYCNKCGIDKGYQSHGSALHLCVKCRNQEATRRTVEQRKIRASMKANLVSRLKFRNLRKNKKTTFDFLGYTVDDLRAHLESKFSAGMTWDNYGKEWEIDHIKPDSWFNYSSTEDEEFKKCWSLDNLQPMWNHENRSKGNRYSGPYDPNK